MRNEALGMLGAAIVASLAACHSAEPVIPFMDAGDPCTSGGSTHAIDCAEFAETTCVVQGSVCPRVTFGCADAAYFSSDDYSQCPPEGGGFDAEPLGDASLLGDGATIGDGAPDGPEAGTSDAGTD